MPADEEVARGVLDADLDPFGDPLSADSRGLFADNGGLAPALTREDEPTSALEEELGLLLVEEEPELVGQQRVGVEGARRPDHGRGHLAG